ncbi:monooxygenase [Deinococcus irradiatisoli]|uniref:Monooxygenase n=1 Tax=Deinococcus irradiatisoli TaxID=2202254 RepID=A0A2Z3JD56_9DEIO|nr:FAD-dependent oxidoreductase [Deinococcus irradiatisoli]AWN21976.1 monooxygenase [Deinococcus irradiatisoli]
MMAVQFPTSSAPSACIVGGGPAGMVLALLFARRGLGVTVLEAARDFDRAFRGDTLHPATLELMEDLGLVERLLKLDHTRAHCARFISPQRTQVVADFSKLTSKYPYLAVMAQTRFLTFLLEELARFPHARVEFGARVEGLIEEGGAVRGVRYRQGEAVHELRAALTIGADGRHSKVRAASQLPLTRLSPGQDVLWFALPRCASDPGQSIDLYLGGPHCLVTTNHGERWQIGYSIDKGSYARHRALGVAPVQEAVRATIPWLANRVHLLSEWRQLNLLSVEVSRLRRWFRPGLLLIGDAAHPISPIGGLGINMAIQDAVACANCLSGPLLRGRLSVRHLARVQRVRAWQIGVLQAQQVVEEREVVSIHGGAKLHLPIQGLNLIHRLPGLRRLPAYLTAYGLRPVRLSDEYKRGTLRFLQQNGRSPLLPG